MSISVSLIPDSPEGKCEKFAQDNYKVLSRLYPDKWVVIVDCKVLFVADSSDEMFEKAEAFAMKRGSYYYRHFEKPQKVVELPSFLGI